MKFLILSIIGTITTLFFSWFIGTLISIVTLFLISRNHDSSDVKYLKISKSISVINIVFSVLLFFLLLIF